MASRIAVIATICVAFAAGAAPAASAESGGAKPQPVDVDIVLAADVSRSVDASEFALQRKGYAAALADPHVLEAIAAARNPAIAVCFVEFAGEDDQHVVVDWSLIRDKADAAAVGAAILAAPRSFSGRTSISAAIDFAMARFGKSKWPAGRRIIDISGDGTNNAGRPIVAARDAAAAAGVTINGLAIINESTALAFSPHTHPPGGLPDYYLKNVIGGPDSFLKVVKNFGSFADAMARKLVREIAAIGGSGAHHRENPRRVSITAM